MKGPYDEFGPRVYTWNPVTGGKLDCPWCETGVGCCAAEFAHSACAKACPNGLEPTFHPERLNEPQTLKIHSNIFVSNMGELFGPRVPDEWIQAVIGAMSAARQHTFFCLTQAPWEAKKWVMPDNVGLGTTITGALPDERERLKCVRDFQARLRFISCYPLVGPVDPKVAQPDWIIIGAADGVGDSQPEESWVRRIEGYAASDLVPIYHKDNLECRPKPRREWPMFVRVMMHERK
jgi:protein gp37